MTTAPRGTDVTTTTEQDSALAQRDCLLPDVRPPAEPITVALISKVMEDLKLLQDRTDLSRTDIANRAITLYEFIDGQLRAGREVLIREKSTGETRVVLIL
jgi:hypothetical protein